MTRMPWGAYSAARVRVRLRTAALAAEKPPKLHVYNWSDYIDEEILDLVDLVDFHKSPLTDIKKFSKGYYVLMQFCGDPGITVEFQRQLGLDDSILKSQTILLSDNADPEALKAEAQATEAKETVEETETETASEDEEKDGVQ